MLPSDCKKIRKNQKPAAGLSMISSAGKYELLKEAWSRNSRVPRKGAATEKKGAQL
jgi:hypothetical protein